MKKFFVIILFMVLILSCVKTRQVQQPEASTEQQAEGERFIETVELTFIFTRQTGPASNQYAIWIENSQGLHIKTLYVTRWTANGGFNRRPTSIPVWVRQSGLSNMSSAQIDVVSGATPRTGEVVYTWDGTDSTGAVVPAGDYILILEGTLRWENQVYYRAPVTLGQLTEGQSAVVQVSTEYVGAAAPPERVMISDVSVRILR